MEGQGLVTSCLPLPLFPHLLASRPLPRRVHLAALGDPPPGATFAGFFNFPGVAATLVSPGGALEPLPARANKAARRFYAASARDGVTFLHPMMLKLWELHTSGAECDVEVEARVPLNPRPQTPNPKH